jgi:hypothetical protein
MRVITLMLVLTLAAVLVAPVIAADYGTMSPPSDTTGTVAPSTEAAPETPAATPSEPAMTPEATPSEVAPETPVMTPSAPVTTPPAISTAPITPPMAMMTPPPEVEAFNRQFVKQYFGVSDADVSDLRSKGLSWAELYMAANLAQRTSQPITKIALLRSQGQSWTDIGNTFNVAYVDLSMPFSSPSRVAGVTSEVIMVDRPLPIVSKSGIVILTRQDAWMYRRMGYTWRDIAFATNISSRCDVPVSDILRRASASGYMWRWVALGYGQDPDVVMDVSQYPFSREVIHTHYME